ncbi:DUF1109 domain-containing protein [uncultured Brevundimonas sp.]|uniref:DUF1109 domain-containing protein n=1 Tax=uncultured Brevundimonas sp. TaxID=213418 RepID=UPI0030EFA4C0|tara:strand:- start:4895 stop:5536 length:642 start_codon:yes stop_codon:yes gene_type:complete
MKTDDLIAALAVELPPARAGQIERHLLLMMVPAAGLVLVGVVLWLGVRGDLATAMTGPVFWSKAAYTTLIAATGFWLLDRLGRPDADVRPPLILLAAIGSTALILAGTLFATAAAGDRMTLLMGSSARVCPTNILVLSALAAPFIFVAGRRFAPDRPMAAGAAAGLLTAGLAATLYGLHCAEVSAVFVAVWYSLGMTLAAGVGAILGRFAFRW